MKRKSQKRMMKHELINVIWIPYKEAKLQDLLVFYWAETYPRVVPELGQLCWQAQHTSAQFPANDSIWSGFLDAALAGSFPLNACTFASRTISQSSESESDFSISLISSLDCWHVAVGVEVFDFATGDFWGWFREAKFDCLVLLLEEFTERAGSEWFEGNRLVLAVFGSTFHWESIVGAVFFRFLSTFHSLITSLWVLDDWILVQGSDDGTFLWGFDFQSQNFPFPFLIKSEPFSM